MVMSNFDAGVSNHISGSECTDVSGDYKSKFSNFKWTVHDSLVGNDTDTDPQPQPDEELVIGNVAESLDECDDPYCSACHESWYESDPTEIFPTCTDYTEYKYTHQCRARMSKDLCGEDDLCFISWPHSDPAKWRSDDKACRPLPERMEEGPFKYARKEKPMNKGLCALGCEDGDTCHMSWPLEDTQRWKSPDAMFRCKSNN